MESTPPSMLPQLGTGWGMPNPKKLSAASGKMALPKEALLKTMKMPEHITKIEEAGQPAVLVGRTEFTRMYNDSFKEIEKWIPKAIKDK